MKKNLKRGPWTRDELTRLRRTYGNSKTAYVALCLGRPVGNVKKRANRMGLKKTAYYRKAVLHRSK